MDKLTDYFEICFPLKQLSRKKSKNKNWITKGILVSISFKNKLYTKYLNKPTDAKKLAFTKFRNKLNHTIQVAKEMYYTELLTLKKDNLTQIWKIYSEIFPKKKEK